MNEREGGFFDPQSEVFISEQHWPHWLQAGTITFVTMRLADSIPADVIKCWDRERIVFLKQHGVSGFANWREGVERLDFKSRQKFKKHFNRLREDSLDTCLGNCELREPWSAGQVAQSLLKFDEDRYAMGDFVIMPNHIHFLIVFREGTMLRKQCGEWMRFTARKVNQHLGRSGTLWYEEPFDHLVRNERQLEYLREYIKNNPWKARLPAGQFLYRRSERHF
jgi:putative transposase